MKIEQKLWTKKEGWQNLTDQDLSQDAQLVLVFGCKKVLEEPDRYDEVRKMYPTADIVICSTAGEIMDGRVYDESISCTAVMMERTRLKTVILPIGDAKDSYAIGKQLIESLNDPELVYTLVISDGHIVNGSRLARALADNRQANSVITGGLAGDGENFECTLVGLNSTPTNGKVVGVGFYGSNLQIGHAAKGGWDTFGPERLVTKSKENQLFELDELPALDLYKKYLGDLADELPGSALLFPLSIKTDDSQRLVRTVLSIDEENKVMTFAGDIPEGSRARMMKSNFERLLDGAMDAADHALSEFSSFEPDFALLISCTGRKMALGNRVEVEVERVLEVLGKGTKTSGFYSYGEISPVMKTTGCELHNQTMTITTFKELPV